MEQQIVREHRAQTNVAVILGQVTKLGAPRIIANKTDGDVVVNRSNPSEPLMVTAFTVRVGDDFIDCEALGALSRAMLGVKVGQNVALTGRYEIRTNPVKKTIEGVEMQFTYQNDKFKVVDRTLDYNTHEPITDAIPPIQIIDGEAKHFFEVRVVGTVGSRGFQPQSVGNRTKAYGSIACNGSKANQPTWFDLSGWDDVMSDMLNTNAKTLVEVRASVRFYRVKTAFGGMARKVDLNVKQISTIAKNAAAPADVSPLNSIKQQAAAATANLLAMLDAPRPKATSPLGDAIDPNGNDSASGADHTADALKALGGTVAPVRRRRRAANGGDEQSQAA